MVSVFVAGANTEKVAMMRSTQGLDQGIMFLYYAMDHVLWVRERSPQVWIT
jgi:hypothetical protein